MEMHLFPSLSLVEIETFILRPNLKMLGKQKEFITTQLIEARCYIRSERQSGEWSVSIPKGLLDFKLGIVYSQRL